MFPRCLCTSFVKTYWNSHNFSTTNYLFKLNHYDSLGVSPKATHTDIKAAYYKLSMLYHPDKNKGSHDASKKFQDISAAYEVLGNFKLRKLYDKGILHTAGAHYAQAEPIIEEDEHPEAKFYRSRQSRHTAPTMSGSTPVYDFDEWSKQHYSDVFDRKYRTSMRYRSRDHRTAQQQMDTKNEVLFFSTMTFLFVFVLISYMTQTDYDYDSLPENNKDKEM